MQSNTIRIIGGKWRGRKLSVLDSQDLRPTPDRVRETVFNWLTPFITGAHCLDLFAGSGALGFEALSRGAKQVTMIDQSEKIIKVLQTEAKKLGAENAVIYQAQAPKALRSGDFPFNIVFLDPPYQKNLLLESCIFLEEHHFLADLAYIYLEADHTIIDNDLPINWRIIKSKKAGQVFYHLAQREKNAGKVE